MTDIDRIVEELILTDALTGDSEGTPTHYTVHADDLPHLVRTVLQCAHQYMRVIQCPTCTGVGCYHGNGETCGTCNGSGLVYAWTTPTTESEHK